MPRPLRVFLCHASQDKPAVWKIYRYLKQHGVQPWLDQADLLPGQNWEVEIPKALFNSDVILVCLSKNSVNKEGYVQKEIVFALDKAMEKPEGTIFIIPLKLEECDVPKRLSSYQWVDYYRNDGRKRLLMGLNMRVQGLGEEVSPIVMEDSKQRTPRKQSATPEIREETSEQIPSKSLKVEEKKQFPRKPFTRILDPATLNPKEPQKAPSREIKKSFSKINYRWLGIAGIILLFIVLGGLGLNSLFNKPPIATATPTYPQDTDTPVPPAPTNEPFTPTLNLTQPPSPTPTTVLGIGSTSRSLKDGMVLVYIPAGEFMMGNLKWGQVVHNIFLNAYWIDQTEITNVMYSKCVEANVCDPPGKKRSQSRPSYFDSPEFANYPVVYVSWDDAMAYCSWMGRTLPTEAQWEKAARGQDERTYPWGENINCNKANYDSSCVGDTTEVGSYLSDKSPYGVYDLAGNVTEWVSDWYDEVYYSNSPSENPLGPENGQKKVERGGSWSSSIYAASSYFRFGTDPNDKENYLGFRCALSQP